MASTSVSDNKILPEHHIQQELCTTRPLYRQGRKLTAVKVYTINNESQHLIIYKVPKIKLKDELKADCLKFGDIKNFNIVTKYLNEEFTECYHLQYERIQSARIAKRFLDNKSFYGEILHVVYAPEYETLKETKTKLLQREKDVISRLEPGPTLTEYANVSSDNTQQNRKRKHPAIPITEKRLMQEGNDDIWKHVPYEIDPRTNTVKINTKTGFKKHYQIENNLVAEKRPAVQYGPHLPVDVEISEPVMQQKAKVVPNKRIVFRINK